MKPNVMLAAIAVIMGEHHSGLFASKGCVVVCPNPQHTRNMFGPISEVAGKTLTVVDVAVDNSSSLCLVPATLSTAGDHLIDIDHHDVERRIP